MKRVEKLSFDRCVNEINELKGRNNLGYEIWDMEYGIWNMRI